MQPQGALSDNRDPVRNADKMLSTDEQCNVQIGTLSNTGRPQVISSQRALLGLKHCRQPPKQAPSTTLSRDAGLQTGSSTAC